MANKKNAEFLEMATEDLRHELESAETTYRTLRFDHATTGLDNPLVLIDVRRDIARIKTELRKRQLSEVSTEDLAFRSKIRARRRRQKTAAKLIRRKTK